MELNPSLVIGLGGTGQLAVSYLKKDLLEACGGEMPPQVRLLVFDTVKQAAVKVGGRGEAERGGEAGGTVALDYGEYVYIGGDAYNLVWEADHGEHPQIASWLQSSFYLGRLARNIYNLSEGAGQYRQFGRLAVFYDVRAPAQSNINNMLTDAIQSIKRNAASQKELQVFIISSLAGGTGSGMFVDMAHIVRQIANLPTVNMDVALRGYLVLPEAFSQDVDINMMTSLQGRAHAAMRESRRFTLNFDYKLGYPMHYHDRGDNPIWRGVVRTKLFDLLYYLDGQRQRNSLSDVPLRLGVAPTLADAVSAVLDAADPERPFQAYPLNIEAEVQQRRSRGDLDAGAAAFGSVGTYTLVFPIHSLIKGWSHQLALEVLDKFLVADQVDEKTKLPLKLADDANEEENRIPGSEGARIFLQTTQVVDPLDPEKIVELTLLPQELAEIGRRHLRQDPDILAELLDRDLNEWNDYFEPSGDDDVSMNARLQARAVLSANLLDGDQKIEYSDDLKEATAQGAQRIEDEVRSFKNIQLGREDASSGQRRGGRYREKLDTYANLHLDRFQQALDMQILTILNGQSRDNYYQSRGGKLGYLLSFLDQIYRDLDAANRLLNGIRTQRQQEDDRRRDAISATRRALKAMKESADLKKFLLGTPRREAYDSQKEYVRKEQDLVDLLRGEIMEQAILDTARRMIEYVDAARQQARGWADALALNRNSLYGQVLAGLQEVESDRQVDALVAVRNVVKDSEYEQRRYEVYVASGARDAVRDVLAGLTWSLEHTQTRGVQYPELKLSVRAPAERRAAAAEAQPDSQKNMKAFLSACRPPFERAMQDESIVGYLMSAYEQPEDLAMDIHKQGGPLLNNSGGNPMQANYLRVYYDREQPTQHAYLERVLNRLTQLNSVGVGSLDEERGRQFAQVVNSGDRFKCSLIHTEEIIELNRIEAFRSSRPAYLSGAAIEGANRSTLHLFPAEVNAVKYEDRLGELNQQPRMFSDAVTIQLEKPSSFRAFLFCYVYDIVRRTMIRDEDGENRPLWQLVLPGESAFDRESDQVEDQVWWLTDPRRVANTIDAIATFNFVGDEVGRPPDYTHPIPYERVRDWLAYVRQSNAEERMAGLAGNEIASSGSPREEGSGSETPGEEDWLRGKVGISYDYLAEELAAIRDRAKLRQARNFAAQIDQLTESHDRLSDGLRQSRPEDPVSADNYDLACIFTLVLRDEIGKLRRAIKDLRGGAALDVSESDRQQVPSSKPKKFDPF